jgi:hypothetical protein
MTGTQLGRWKFAVRTSLLFAIGAIFTACCPRPPTPPQPIAACKPGSPPSSPTELDACLQGFAFDTAYEVGDEQPLTVMGVPPGPPCPTDEKKTRTCRYGPLAKIEPLIGAQNYSEKDLREGRFIARLSIPSSEKEGYRKYGLQPGAFTYWWVKTDSTGTGGQSVFITMTKDRRISSVPRPLVRELYYEDKAYSKRARVGRASVRWLWTLDDETAKGQCGTATCK